MVYEVIIAVILIAYIKKGTLKNIHLTKIQYPSFIIGSFLIQLAAVSLDSYHPFFERISSILIFLAYSILLFSIWKNRRLPGFFLIAAGIAMNFAVITLNGGRMPVSLDAIKLAGLHNMIPHVKEGLSKHILMDRNTVLAMFGDIIPLKPPYAFKRIIISIGDIFVTVGFARFIYIKMTKN